MESWFHSRKLCEFSLPTDQIFFFSFEGSALVHDLLPINSAFAPGAFFCKENNHMISPVGGSKGAAGCIHQNSPA